MPETLLTSLAILAALGAAVKPLRSGFYALHMALVACVIWLIIQRLGDSALFSERAIALFLAAHLCSINPVTFLAYAVDKNAARKGKWRIPEKRLLALMMIGGTAGGYIGQKVFRHKTRKVSFQKLSWLVLTLQACLLAALLYR